jgi:imidazolonepropionase-like amidohydrolase
MSEMEAIHAATVAAADLIDRSDDLGTVEAGKLADIIAVDADPLNDITALENVSVVIKEGRRIK